MHANRVSITSRNGTTDVCVVFAHSVSRHQVIATRYISMSAGRYDTLLSAWTNLLTQKQDEAANKPST